MDIDPRLTKMIGYCQTAQPADYKKLISEFLTWQSYSHKYWARYFITFCRSMTLDDRKKLARQENVYSETIGGIAVYSPNIDMPTRRNLCLQASDNPLSWLRMLDEGRAKDSGEFWI